MKKNLLFVILALSINAEAQNLHPISNNLLSSSNPFNHVVAKMVEDKEKSNKSYPEMNFGKSIKPPTLMMHSPVQLIDSFYTWEWDTLIYGWKVYSKSTTIVYDVNYNPIYYLVQGWTGTAWVNFEEYILAFDNNNNRTSLTYTDWDGNGWVNSTQYLYSYDANNNQTLFKYNNWNGSAWENYLQVIYTYDANLNLSIAITQLWNGNAWENYDQSTSVYDGFNNLTSYTYQNWYDDEWKNTWRYTYSYDGNNHLISQLNQNWFFNDVDWTNADLYTYYYDTNNNLSSKLHQTWNGSDWEDYGLYTYTYDANHNLTGEFTFGLDGMDWVNFLQHTVTYDVNNFTISDTYKSLNFTTNEIEFGDSTHYYFHTLTGMDEVTAKEGSINVYPNPTDGKFTLCSNNTLRAVEIYNLLGERIYSNSKIWEQDSIEIDLSSFGTGIYFINMDDGAIMHTQSIVVQ